VFNTSSCRSHRFSERWREGNLIEDNQRQQKYVSWYLQVLEEKEGLGYIFSSSDRWKMRWFSMRPIITDHELNEDIRKQFVNSAFLLENKHYIE
jgi:hypothetical protein